ncbi:MAG: hypothetical protein IT381_06165 [Deltaproteobacteria bacterium]|nr:hypothetical protein [Deltaproteobacteria bacterium]
MERSIVLQADASGGAALFVALKMPRIARAGLLRRSWDRDGDQSVSATEASLGARELAATMMDDVVIEADRQAARCVTTVRSRDADGALDDRSFEIAVLVECEPGREWLVYAGARLATTFSVRADHACVAATEVVQWLACP